MLSEFRTHVMLASIFGCLLLFSPVSQAAGEPQLGRVLYSRAANLRGMPAPGSETILRGDVLTTSEDGSALVELKRGAKLKIEKSSSVRFLGDGETVQAELLLGEVVSESTGIPTMVVTTPEYQFAPAQEGECRYVVQRSKEQMIVAGAMKGNVLVKARDANGSYVLHQGNYAAISGSVAGVPGQATVAGGQLGGGHAGTVSDVIPDVVVQRQGQGAEIPLAVNDGIDRQDAVDTGENGRLRIALSDGSFLNIGSASSMKIITYDPKTHQTVIRLTSGRMRAWVVQPTQPGSSFKVETPTAVTGEVGLNFIVKAEADVTRVYCIEGLVSVRNIDTTVAGQVILHAGEFTEVVRGLTPSAPETTTDVLLERELDRTMVAPAAAGQRRSAPAGWHIGSLSEAESIGLLVGIGAGAAAAAIAVPAITGGPASPSAP